MSTRPRMTSTPTIPVLTHRIAELARDKKALEVRCAALVRALTGRVPATHVAIVRGAATLEPTLRIAQLLESQGRVPVVRWARGADGMIAGIELAVVQTAEECRASEAEPRPEMAVVAEDESGSECGGEDWRYHIDDEGWVVPNDATLRAASRITDRSKP